MVKRAVEENRLPQTGHELNADSDADYECQRVVSFALSFAWFARLMRDFLSRVDDDHNERQKSVLTSW
jgi:hypothetical protein